MGCNGEILCDRSVASRCKIVVWSRQREVVLSNVSGLAVYKARKAPYIAAFAVIVGGSCRVGHGISVSFFVVDGSQSVRVSGSIAARTEIRTHPEGRV